jgi:hypothetical protein
MSNIYYIPAPAAEALSKGLWELSRPPALQQNGDTELMFEWIDDSQGNKWIEVKDNFSIIIHPNATLGRIASVLQPWIDSGSLPKETNQNLSSLIEAKRRQRLVVYDAFPPLFKNMAKTFEEMQALGLFPSESE